MRFYFANNRHPMAIAKKLKAMFPDKLTSLGHSQGAVAHVLGWEDWHEFSKSMKDGSEHITPWDDEVSLEEAASRNSVLIGRFAKEFGLSEAEAKRAVVEIRPLARISTPKSSLPDWRKKLDDPRYADRFFGPKGREDAEVIEEYRRDIARKVKGNYSIKIEHEGEEFELLVERSDDRAETPGNTGRSIYSVLVKDGRIVGTILGAVFSVRRTSIMDSGDYADLFDAVDDETCQMGLEFVRSKSAHRLFATGKSTFFISAYEVQKLSLPKGTGRAYLKALAKLIVPLEKPFGSLAILNDPRQYADMDVNERLHNKSYQDARTNLNDYFANTNPERLFGEKCVFFPVSETRSETGNVKTNNLLSLGRELSGSMDGMAYMAEFDRLLETAHPMLKEAFEFTARQHTAHLDAATRTHPSEPMPISEAHPLPDDFNLATASFQKSFAPHKLFWNYMPSDLIQATVTYKTAMPDFDADSFDGELLHHIDFKFRNGTHIEIGADQMILGSRGEELPDSMVGPTGQALSRNPFTEKYSTMILAWVLKANGMLLFDGELREVVRAPSEPVSITRP